MICYRTRTQPSPPETQRPKTLPFAAEMAKPGKLYQNYPAAWLNQSQHDADRARYFDRAGDQNMNAQDLLQALLQEDQIDTEKVQSTFDALPESVSLVEFRNQLIQQKVISYSQAMSALLNNAMLPNSKRLLQKLKKERESKVHFEPERHQTKFHLTADDNLSPVMELDNGAIAIEIPRPIIEKFMFKSSDEKQAVSLAFEMALSGEVNEAEVILLEVVEMFPTSLPTIYTLCWIYLSTGHGERVEYWAQHLLQQAGDRTLLKELLAMATQSQSKHLMAATQLQQMVQAKKVRPVWYLMLAYSLERAACIDEAIEYYRIYSTVAGDSPLKSVAQEHLNELLNP